MRRCVDPGAARSLDIARPVARHAETGRESDRLATRGHLIYSKTAPQKSRPTRAENLRCFHHLEAGGPWPAGLTARTTLSSGSRADGHARGNGFEVSQPIEMRFNELIAGVRGDVAISCSATIGISSKPWLHKSPPRQRRSGHGRLAGRADRRFPTLGCNSTGDAIARYGLSIEDVPTPRRRSGRKRSWPGLRSDRRFDIVVRLDNVTRDTSTRSVALPVMLESTGPVPRASVR